MPSASPGGQTAFQREVASRFGLVPNFFASAPEAPEVIERLWDFAKTAYLDNPIPSLFKERLFVYLSRFCEARYCIVRHCAFLVGRGHSSGDASVVVQTVEQAIKLLKMPPPWDLDLKVVLGSLEALPAIGEWPAAETEPEDWFIAAATLVFAEPARSERARNALHRFLGGNRFEHLLGLLAFIRTAHYWTVLHPQLTFEEDARELLKVNEVLSRLLLQDPEAARCEMSRRMFVELTELREFRQAEQALAERNIQLTLAEKAGLVGTYAYDVDTEIMQISAGYAAIHGFPEDTNEIARSECLASVHPDDIGRVERFRSEAFRERRREYSVEYRIIRPGGELRWVETRCFISFSGAGHSRQVIGVSIDITERKRVEEQQSALLAELDHRVKNALATVSAVISHSWQASTSIADFVEALDGRIRSMATTHELLSSHRWQGVSLIELVQRELAPYATRNNTEINGPDIALKPEAGQAIAMVLHELTTNAAKYGALSAKNGRVSIRWGRHLKGDPRSHLVFEWQEIGGSPVVALGKSNYGMSTIRDLIPYEFGGTVDLVLAQEGVRCRLELPADWLGNDRQPLSETTAH